MSDAAPAAPSAPSPAAAAPAASTPPEAKGAAAAPPAEPAKAEPKHKVKVNGKEVEVTTDELLRRYSLEHAGEENLRQAKELEKSAKSIVESVKKSDVAALRAAGLSDDEIEQLSITYLSEKQKALLEEERKKGLSPEQREIEELRKLKAEIESKTKTEQEAQHKAAVDSAVQKVTGDVIATLELLPEHLRRNDVFAKRAFEAWEYAIENEDALKARGIAVTPKLIADAMLKEMRSLSRTLVETAGDDELEEYVPPTVREKLLKKAAATAQATAHPALTSQPAVRDEKSGKFVPVPKSERKSQAQIEREAIFGKRK